MTEATALTARVTKMELVKRQGDPQTGEVFEVIEYRDGQPTVVTFRKEGVAPHESYAWDLPCMFAGAQE